MIYNICWMYLGGAIATGGMILSAHKMGMESDRGPFMETIIFAFSLLAWPLITYGEVLRK